MRRCSCLDDKTIIELSQIINKIFQKHSKGSDLKKRINGVLRNKSVSNVIRELSNYTCLLSKQDKNISTIIVVISLFQRNLDSILELKNAIQLNRLEGQLFGGLFVFLNGKSSRLCIDAKLNDSLFKNKYEFITRFFEFNYWDYIGLFLSAELLSLVDPDKFEKLAFEDKTRLLLLNMTSHHLDVLPSNALIRKLLKDDDELNQNIGFYFATRSISKCINDIENTKRLERLGMDDSSCLKSVPNNHEMAINECFAFLEICNERTQVALLTNFLLSNQTIYPSVFARKLLHSDLQEEFIYQIRNTGKINNLKDTAFFIDLISITPALNKEKKRISKNALYMEFVNIILKFIDKRQGICQWNEQQKQYMQLICSKLPVSCIKKLKSYITEKDKSLMFNKFDKMIRFQIYIEDSCQHEIISGIINIIDSMDN